MNNVKLTTLKPKSQPRRPRLELVMLRSVRLTTPRPKLQPRRPKQVLVMLRNVKLTTPRLKSQPRRPRPGLVLSQSKVDEDDGVSFCMLVSMRDSDCFGRA